MVSPLPADSIRCVRCGQDRPPESYPRSPGKRNGRHSWCKGCLNDYSRGIRRARGEQPAQRRVRVRSGFVRCAACGKDLPESEFRPDSRGKPYSYCRTCHNAYLAELNRTKRKDPAVRTALKRADRRRRGAQKREMGAERRHRLAAAQTIIDRLRGDGWSLRRLAAEAGLARSTLQHIRAGHVPYPETYERLRAFAREQRSAP